MKNRFLPCLIAALALGTVSAIDTDRKPGRGADEFAAPRVTFKGIEARGAARAIVFEVFNPNPETTITFSGYLTGPENKPVSSGSISPLYAMQQRKAGEWVDRMVGWCGTGAGRVPLAPLSRTTFVVGLPWDDAADAIKVGLRWSNPLEAKSAPRIAWSDAVPRKLTK